MKKKVYIVSPREPSGATWLINCFLELGIKCYRVQESQMWIKTECGYVLTKEENILKQWLPILSLKKSFFFREDIEVQWTHEWPQEKFEGHKIIFFTRDPRDSLYSRYKRESPNLAYDEYINFLDDKSLLDKIDNWVLFHLSWIQNSNLKIFSFEDYKKDAYLTLNSILSWIKVDFNENMKVEAIKNSTSEIASLAEKRYLETTNIEDKVNQGGIVGRWKENYDETCNVSISIEQRASFLMSKLGYDITNTPFTEKDFLSRVSFSIMFNPFFNELQLNKLYILDYEYLAIIDNFVDNLNELKLKNSKLKAYELFNIKQMHTNLLNSFIEYLNKKKIFLESKIC